MFLDVTSPVSLSSKEFGNSRDFQAEQFLKVQKARVVPVFAVAVWKSEREDGGSKLHC